MGSLETSTIQFHCWELLITASLATLTNSEARKIAAAATCDFTIINTQTKLYSPPTYPATIGYLLTAFFTWHISYYNKPHKHYYTSSTMLEIFFSLLQIQTMCSMKYSNSFNHALFGISYFIFAPATSQDPLFYPFLQVFMLYHPK